MAEFLIGVVLRSLALAALAGVASARVRSAARRHAVWTLVTAGMLAVAMAMAALPALPVRVLARAPRLVPAVTMIPLHVATALVATPVPKARFPWEGLFGALYAAGFLALAGRLAYGYRLTRKLVRASRRIARFESEAVYESECVAVPLTVGWLRPKILLPAGWDEWEPEKLEVVLVHERHHVRRGDWAIAVWAGVNRCVFWFHPLAWWLEARLKVLAEEACDDASLAQVVSREYYAQVLVEIAAVLRTGEGRVDWAAPAMAKGAEVGMRVERILDESRQIPAAMTRGRWALLVLCAVPVMYLAAVTRPARVRAQDPPQNPPAAVQQAPATPPDAALQAAREELARTEEEVAKFKTENMGRLPEQFQANVAQLNSLQMMLGQSNEVLNRLQQERLMLETQLENLNRQLQFNSVSNSGAENLAEERIRDLQSQLAELRETLSPQHPGIKRLEERLAAAEAARDGIATHAKQKAALDLEGSINMVKTEMQNLNLQMDGKVKQTTELSRQIAAYQQRIESTPQLEERYTRLREAMERLKELETRLQASANGQGSVQLEVTFGADGRPQKIRVTRGHGLPEDEKAVEWAKSLRLAPDAQSGPAAPAVITVEVPFPVK